MATELVQWFNSVDNAYRLELRDLFEVHFARLDARLEQRVGGFEARLAETKAELRSEMASGLAGVRSDFAERLAKSHSGLIWWMFAFWAGNVAAMAALMLGAVALLKH